MIGTIVAAVVVATAPFHLDIYTKNVLIRAFFLAALAMTVDVLWGYTGILTFGQSAFFGIGAYACALVAMHFGFGPFWFAGAFLVALLASVAVAWLIGWLAFYHGASPLYGSIVTLALPIVFVQLIFAGGRFTGSSSGISSFPTYYWSFETWFWIAGGYLIAVTALGYLLVKSDFGRILVAIRENEERCAYLGLPVSRIKIVLMMAAGAIGAGGGFGYAAFTNVVAPELGGFLLGTELLIFTALGGRGTLIGPVVGTIGIDVTASYLSGSLPFLWKLITGVAFVAVIVLLPQGLIPIIGQGLRRLWPVRHRESVDDVTLRSFEPTAPHGETSSAPLRTEGLQRHYGSLKVLDGIAIESRASELLSIVGPNGAGKTTLMRCVSDGGERSGGQVFVNGTEIGRGAPQSVVALGIGRSFQNTNLFETLTVADCLLLARWRIDGASLFSRRSEIALPRPAVGILQATGLDKALATQTRNLSHGQKRGLELAMVLASEPSVLLLDEPTAGLTKAERTAIGDVLTALAREHGLSILLIEHDLDFVRDISDRIVVLHQGALLMEGTVDEVIASTLVKAVYSGQSVETAP
ncbi:MAG: branched-chain amino acid ABC transporter ATP-binding protein/permease [Pseudomonadota bacterium]